MHSEDQSHTSPELNPMGEVHHTQIESEPWKLDQWANELGIPKQQVRQLAAEVGPVFTRIKARWEEKLSERITADEQKKTERASTELTANAARHEVLEWLRQASGASQSLRDEDESRAPSDELVKRFMSHAEPAGFVLKLIATGTPASPRWRGDWRCHGAEVQLADIADAPSRDEASLIACAALLRDPLCSRYLNKEDAINTAA